MSDAHHGSCLCGAVRFEIDAAFEGFFLCHCSRCRKGAGSAHAANLFASRGALRWLSGAENVRTFALAGTRHARSFCAACGSALPRVLGDAIIAPAGSLDSALSMRPTAHICMASRADWDHDLEAAPRLDGLPA
ncbi:MAG TPA: GFA family protein [Terricaulis sp.]|nr:GFA family protein [Terricaulis sp.]